MMITLFTMNMMMSLIFLSLTHPLSMGLILLTQTLLVSLITGNFNYNLWFSYILFLIMVGGMLILFMYMTSIASNEKFSFNMKSLILTIIIPTMLMIPATKLMMNNINNDTLQLNMNMIINISMNKYINYPTNMIMIMMIMYLLLALVATVKITNFKHGPLRQMN